MLLKKYYHKLSDKLFIFSLYNKKSMNAQEAILKIKEDGILAGVEVAKKIFTYVQPNILFTAYKKDGDQMKFGEIAFDVEANVHTILQAERLVLNTMQRMSGIATLTKKYTDKLKGYKTKLLDTRKTTPNFRLLEKEAVKCCAHTELERFALPMWDRASLLPDGLLVAAITVAWHLLIFVIQQVGYK